MNELEKNKFMKEAIEIREGEIKRENKKLTLVSITFHGKTTSAFFLLETKNGRTILSNEQWNTLLKKANIPELRGLTISIG